MQELGFTPACFTPACAGFLGSGQWFVGWGSFKPCHHLVVQEYRWLPRTRASSKVAGSFLWGRCAVKL